MPALDMVRAGERFYTSLGFAPLPKTFWERSLFVRPKDRDVVCHASAWDVDYVEDVRIKMCIEPTAEDFTTIHHELGHNFYQRAYKDQPVLFRDSANDGFHEAIGDTDRALGDAGVPGEDRPARQGARYLARHRPADDARAREDLVPALRPADRSMALEGVLRRDHAGAIQQGLVGSAPQVPGRGAAVGARRGVLRSRAPSITSPTTRRTRATSSPPSCSSSFTARWRRRPAARCR